MFTAGPETDSKYARNNSERRELLCTGHGSTPPCRKISGLGVHGLAFQFLINLKNAAKMRSFPAHRRLRYGFNMKKTIGKNQQRKTFYRGVINPDETVAGPTGLYASAGLSTGGGAMSTRTLGPRRLKME